MKTIDTFMRWKDRLHKPERDAGRAMRVYREYDIGHRYDAYHQHCRAKFQRGEQRSPKTQPEPALGEPLHTRGFEYFTLLPEADAAAWRSELEQNHSSGLIKKDSRHLYGFHVDDRKWTENLLSRMLTGPVDRRIADFFGSEYLLHWVTFSLTRQAAEQDSVSFRWHCDKGPTAHLKLMVYLNATEEHGGNTEFIGLDDTHAVARRGYLFGSSKSRSSDIEHLADIAGQKLTAHLNPLTAGQGVLFQPARVLHRGISPTRGERLTMTLCILPSPVNWKLAWQCGTLSDLAVDDKWHDDATGIISQIENQLPRIKESEQQ